MQDPPSKRRKIVQTMNEEKIIQKILSCSFDPASPDYVIAAVEQLKSREPNPLPSMSWYEDDIMCGNGTRKQ